MAVGYDISASNVGGGAGTTLAVSITVGAGTNRVLIVVTECFDSGTSVSSISGAGATWAGAAFGTLTNVPLGVRWEMWSGIAPSTGAQTVTVTWASSVAERFAAVFSFNGANQTTPLANYASSTASASQTITTTNGDGAVSACSFSGGAPTVSGCTTTVDQAQLFSTFYAATHCLASGASTAFTWAGTTFDGVQGAAVQQAVAAAAVEEEYVVLNSPQPPGTLVTFFG